MALFALSVESVFAPTGKACALTYGRSDVLRIVGREFAPAGDLLLCFAKEEGKKGDPATPVIRCANDCPALLPAGGRRGTRPSGSDSRAGLPRPLLRCSAGRNGLFGYTEPLRNLSRALAVDHLHFLSPLARRLEGSAGGKRAAHV